MLQLLVGLCISLKAAAPSTKVTPELLASLNLADVQLDDACKRDAQESWDIPEVVLHDLLGRKVMVFEEGSGLHGVRTVLAGASLTYSVFASVGALSSSVHSQVQIDKLHSINLRWESAEVAFPWGLDNLASVRLEEYHRQVF
jgi:hypothetical protein